MDRVSFESLFRQSVPVNSVFSNPGGGTSTVCKIGDDRVVYKRGSSRMTLLLDDLYLVYKELEVNTKVSSSDLKQLKPSVFDSTKNGHSCNCTFVFTVLNQMGISNDIGGKGVRGNPFYTTFA
ncbi:hypothetical protein A3K86_10805 [Photobacterium jeanii]|uniref:Uncharacterized protein n=2 Tax=Photobacterium jeanii TaxID=858640 RepID=A0A178KGN5_9GAMM|nr:hypothetical protein A3K86_10805 [Photobacterium jeanii]PST86078.1 hypothetical protein C9I91_22175 [Photobacterium jeanii]